MSGRIHSVNVGRPEPSEATPTRITGIAKRSVAEIQVSDPGPRRRHVSDEPGDQGHGSGVDGDFIGDPKHHGGTHQAVYAVAREELDAWGERLGRDLPDGMFGENLTTAGLPVDDAVVGERWAIGDEVVLRVCGPRIPCRTFAAHMGERGWVKRFTEVGRTGAYLAVERAGTVRPGDSVRRVDLPEHGVTVPEAFRALMGDREAAGRVVAAACLREDEHQQLVARLAED